MKCPSMSGGMSGVQRSVPGIMRDRFGIFMLSGDITVHSGASTGHGVLANAVERATRYQDPNAAAYKAMAIQ